MPTRYASSTYGSEAFMIQISISEADAGMLRQTLDAKLVDLRREISHTDSHRFRDILYQLEAMLERVIGQLPDGKTAPR
jgi:hypothetical protein